MATLDDKILDGPNVGYCSDSDEELDERPVFWSEAPESESSELSHSHQGISTGPKSVLADYRRHEQQKLIERRDAESKLIREAKRFTLEESGIYKNDEDKNQEEEDDDELMALRKRRLEQLKTRSCGRITEITNSEQFLQATDGERMAVIHIYRDGLDATSMLNNTLLEIAGRTNAERAKFYKVKAAILGTSGAFAANALPTLQIYERGILIGNFIRITDELGEDFTTARLLKFLEKHDIDFN